MGTQREGIGSKNMKSTCPMPDPRVGDPMSLIFRLLALGFGVGGTTNFSVSHWRSKPMRGLKANGFASQWNIGLKLIEIII